MSRIKYILLRNKNAVLLCVFCLAVVVGHFFAQRLFLFFIESEIIDVNFANYTQLLINLLIIGLITYFASRFIFNIEDDFLRKQNIQIDKGYPIFLESVRTLENVEEFPYFTANYIHLYSFLHLGFFIELKLTKIKTFEISWYNSITGKFIGSRTIYYENEPIVQVALGNGPYYSIKLNFWYDSKSK